MTGYERAVFTAALERYGKQAQVDMVMEEMAELQKELCKNLRGKKNKAEIAEEIADVSIMLDQMALLFKCEKNVQVERQYKVNRLLERLGLSL